MRKKANWHKAKHGLIAKAKNIIWSTKQEGGELKNGGEKNIEKRREDKRRGKERRRRKRKRRRREEKKKGRAKRYGTMTMSMDLGIFLYGYMFWVVRNPTLE